MTSVSIVIPVYNGARHIRSAIDSVLAQAGVDLDLVVVDNASTDDTVAIVESYDDPRVKLERNPTNIGAPRNFDRALGLATGRYVKLLPADDLLEPGSLARQVAVLDGDGEERIALVFGARTVIDDKGRPFTRRGLPRARAGRLDPAWLVRRCVRKGTNLIGEPGAVLFRRSLALRVGGFDPSLPYVIDLDYWVRLLAHGDAWYLADPVSCFRVAAGSWSSALGDRQSSEFIAFLDRVRASGRPRLSAADVALGRAMAKLNNLLRLVFYRFFVKNHG